MSKLPFEIRAEHSGRETIDVIVVQGQVEVDSCRLRLGDEKNREQLAKRWHDRFCGACPHVTVRDIEHAILEKERLVRESIDRGDAVCVAPIQSSTLLGIITSRTTLFHDDFGIGYAAVQTNGHQETYAIRSHLFRQWLRREYFTIDRRSPTAHSIADAVHQAESHALFAGPRRAVGVRLIGHGDALYLDLGDASWTAIRISPDACEPVVTSEVHFRRPPGLQALPMPVHGGRIEMLREFVNVGTDEQFLLLVAWIVSTFMPFGPYPVLIVNGEQGSAKSTTSRVVRALVDPNAVPLRSPCRSEQDLAIAAHNNRVLALDNVSSVPEWLSDALCRVATGGGFATRALFTDSDESLFTGSRPVLLNGIGDYATRPDLLDRAVRLNLPAIPEERSVDEATFWQRFKAVQPAILGAMLDAIVVALRRLPETRLDRCPRMADFARWMVSAEPGLGWRAGTFMRLYWQNRTEANDLALCSSPVAEALMSWASDLPWEGTATELLRELDEATPESSRRARAWPREPSQLGRALRRLVPNLRAAGVIVDFGAKGRGTQRRRSILISKAPQSNDLTVPAVLPIDRAVSDQSDRHSRGQTNEEAASPDSPPGASDSCAGDGGDSGDSGDGNTRESRRSE